MRRFALATALFASLSLVVACGGSSGGGGGGGGGTTISSSISSGALYDGPTNIVAIDRTNPSDVDNASTAIGNSGSELDSVDGVMSTTTNALQSALGGSSSSPANPTETFASQTIYGVTGSATASGSVSYEETGSYMMFLVNLLFSNFSEDGVITMDGGMGMSMEMKDTTDDYFANGYWLMAANLDFDNLNITDTDNGTNANFDGGFYIMERTDYDDNGDESDSREVMKIDFDMDDGTTEVRMRVDVTGDYTTSCSSFTYCTEYVGTASLCTNDPAIDGCVNLTVDVVEDNANGYYIDGMITLETPDGYLLYVYGEVGSGVANVYSSDDAALDAEDTLITTTSAEIF